MKQEKLKKNWKTTTEMRYAETYLSELQEQLPNIVKASSFWKKQIPIKEKIVYLEELARARSVLWGIIYKVYPDCIGKSLSFGQKYIKEMP